MARNKHPEETVRKILDVSVELFSEKGYDNTSMQDIVTALGMSKGAVYHHFKSKEELFHAAVEDFYARSSWTEGVLEDASLNAVEKLRRIIQRELTDPRKTKVDQLYTRWADPRAQMEHQRQNLSQGAPAMAEVIRQGNRDGSCHVALPLETAELVFVLINTWLTMPSHDRENLRRRVCAVRRTLDSLGLPLFDDALERQFIDYIAALPLETA